MINDENYLLMLIIKLHKKIIYGVDVKNPIQFW